MAREAGIFNGDAIESLLRPPQQQLLLDHLLAQRYAAAHPERWSWGHFAVLYPSGNTRCQSVVSSYETALADPGSFHTVTLESFVETLRAAGGRELADALDLRYLTGTS